MVCWSSSNYYEQPLNKNPNVMHHLITIWFGFDGQCTGWPWNMHRMEVQSALVWYCLISCRGILWRGIWAGVWNVQVDTQERIDPKSTDKLWNIQKLWSKWKYLHFPSTNWVLKTNSFENHYFLFKFLSSSGESMVLDSVTLVICTTLLVTGGWQKPTTCTMLS